MKRIRVFTLAAFALSGCVALTKNEPSAPIAAQTSVAAVESVLIPGAIGEPQIPKGECGMVLWTLDADRPMPVFRFISGGRGEIVLDNAPHALTLESAAGAAGFGVYEKTAFSGEDGLVVDISVRFGSGFENGAYLQQGLIAVEAENGWRSVTPVAGIAGCRG